MCWKCGNNQDFSQSVYRNSTCPNCGADLHSCRGCAFYAPGNHFDCREDGVENIVEKERGNFCESFRAGKNSKWTSSSSAAAGQSKADAARDAFNSLFGA